MDNTQIIETLRSIQGEPIDCAELVCSPAPFSYGVHYVYQDPEDYALEAAIKALEIVEKLKSIGYCHNYQLERFDLIEWIDSVNHLIKDVSS